MMMLLKMPPVLFILGNDVAMRTSWSTPNDSVFRLPPATDSDIYAPCVFSCTLSILRLPTHFVPPKSTSWGFPRMFFFLHNYWNLEGVFSLTLHCSSLKLTGAITAAAAPVSYTYACLCYCIGCSSITKPPPSLQRCRYILSRGNGPPRPNRIRILPVDLDDISSLAGTESKS